MSNSVWKDMKDAPRDGKLIICHNDILGTTAIVGFSKPLHGNDMPHWSDTPNTNAAESLWFNEHYFTQWTEIPPLPAPFKGTLPI